jgi:hypothetical protein
MKLVTGPGNYWLTLEVFPIMPARERPDSPCVRTTWRQRTVLGPEAPEADPDASGKSPERMAAVLLSHRWENVG